MTLVVDEIPAPETFQESAEKPLAPWYLRAGAFAVDVLPGFAVVATLALVSFTVPPDSLWWWMSVCLLSLVVLLISINRLLVPTVTGWSLGRALCGIAVARRDGKPIGPWRLLVRDLAHLLDTVPLLVGWLWPLWEPGRRTFADMLLHTEVRCVGSSDRLPKVRRWTAVALLTAAAVCLGGAAVSYTVVYMRAQAIDRTRAEISTQGPKLVAQMLTYDPKTLREDFARAQSVTTDRYRGQLAAQQDTVAKGHPVLNEYWPTASSVQSATPDRATMLLFMQGRRGEPPELRYISATVRVTFAKGRDNRWRVDDLTVLTKPKPPGDGK
ncbi:RDD family protein [Mycobacterium simiae]|uniref:RDD family protein n=1 Tax=Mycobacterium simiae TaxID=1784 RepID=A0A5B1BK70_MYCSI|nr:RDD family protein [Mycobacterium simiae]KAA1249087.1 RDD family protein [Mycobacterium simiae]